MRFSSVELKCDIFFTNSVVFCNISFGKIHRPDLQYKGSISFTSNEPETNSAETIEISLRTKNRTVFATITENKSHTTILASYSMTKKIQLKLTFSRI